MFGGLNSIWNTGCFLKGVLSRVWGIHFGAKYMLNFIYMLNSIKM